MFLSLSIICVSVSLVLAQLNRMTERPIAEAKAAKLQNAIKEVVPDFDNDPVAESYKMPDEQGDSITVYPAKKGDDVVGFAIKSYSNNGFSGNIQVLVGIDMQSKVVNYSVLSHAETPGLGSKMVDWFKDTSKPAQSVIGRDLSKGKLTVSKDAGEIDAITASTISSRAFLETINKAYAVYQASDKDAESGATTKNDNEKTAKGESSHE